MDFRAEKVEAMIVRLDALVSPMPGHASPGARAAIERWRADAAAMLFHLRRRPDRPPPILVVVGGTGTGKSTIVNRLLEELVSATSLRRTFTSGAVAIASLAGNLPADWLGVEHVAAAQVDLPARGQAGKLTVVTIERDMLRVLSLVDTPDLDGDQPAHHAEADRAFRWADAVLFVVTPEKYQMTELLPYYRLAWRYRVPAAFVMNKCEQRPVVEDYQRLLKLQSAEFGDDRIFTIPRDDAGYEPPPGQNLDALRRSLPALATTDAPARAQGLRSRAEDLLGRLHDQVLVPLRQDRQEVDRLMALLRAMETPVPGVDVNPVTAELQRRMRQRSVLYLIGPQRVLERVRQMPGLLVRLPRVAWDYVIRGEIAPDALQPGGLGGPREVPDFRAILIDQLAILQSRLDDALRTSALAQRWPLGDQPPPYRSALLDPSEAGRIADEELAELKAWLERRWNATPRDTRVLETLLKHLPGGKRVTQWTEAAPYLLVLIVATATHHLLGGIDLAVIGGWSVATWITERLSNEVAARTRRTNQRITDRFAQLAHDQIERLCRWLDEQAPSAKALDQLERALESAAL